MILKELDVVDLIISPIVINDNNVGAVVILLFENSIRHNKEKYINIIKESTTLLSDVLISWVNEYLVTQKHFMIMN